ncbi:MAG: hypothetical protein WA188_16950 [Terriglobales bacterium]
MALNYREMFDAVQKEIVAKKRELGECMNRVERLEDEIAGLEQSAAGFAKTLGEQYVAEDALGLTDAVRRVFRQNQGRGFTALEVRDELKNMGYDLTQFGNHMASIHAVIKRLDGRDLRATGNRSDGKQVYELNLPKVSKAPPPPTEVGRR